MTDLLKRISEVQEPLLKYGAISRRSFLKGALAVGGALALSGCGGNGNGGEATEVIKTVTVTQPVTVTNTVTVTEQAPAAVGPPVDGSRLPAPITAASYIIPEYTNCIGCRKCMVACSIKHYGEPDLFKSSIQVYNVQIEGGMVDIPVLCMKCNDTPCKEACPPAVNAISVNETTGAVIVDNNKCTACNACVQVCAESRTGCLRISKDRMSLVGMCDLCDGDPECVKICADNCLYIYRKNVDGKRWALSPRQLAERTAYVLYGVPMKETYGAAEFELI